MIEGIISLDKGIFLYLNSLGSKSYDVFWLIITNKFFNIFVYFIILFKFKMKYGVIKTLHLFLFTLILIGIVDQTTNFSKFFFWEIKTVSR